MQLFARKIDKKNKASQGISLFFILSTVKLPIFVKEAAEVGLDILPYHGGFFITVPTENPKAAAEKLTKDNIFIVPLKKGLRFAVCALPTAQIPGLATKTKAACK